jgi:hypothetical protein
MSLTLEKRVCFTPSAAILCPWFANDVELFPMENRGIRSAAGAGKHRRFRIAEKNLLEIRKLNR